MSQILCNGVSLEVEQHGPVNGAPLLLIAGLGTQLPGWPQQWISNFAERGYRVIAFDNRDVGLSEKFACEGVPNIESLHAMPEIHHTDIPYTIDDMADDAVGLLDALEIESAHFIGKSMGGMILQAAAYRHPTRLRSATLIVSTSGAPDLPPGSAEAEALTFGENHEPREREAVIEFTLQADLVWGSPKYPFDPEVRRELVGRLFDRCHYPDGVARQKAALLQSKGKQARLAALDLQTLVVQGLADSIFSQQHGRDLAARIKGARLLEVEGMGHDLEGAAVDIVFGEICALIQQADGLSAHGCTTD